MHIQGGIFIEYTKLGNSDLNVSRICMGCMGFGNAKSGMHSWTVYEEHSREILKRGLEHGWAKFVSIQGHYNLLFREEEREMIPFCKDQNIALTPYSPLASGRLAKKPSELSKRLQEAESAVSSTLEPCSIRYCIALMKELKMELQKTAFAQISDCVPPFLYRKL